MTVPFVDVDGMKKRIAELEVTAPAAMAELAQLKALERRISGVSTHANSISDRVRASVAEYEVPFSTTDIAKDIDADTMAVSQALSRMTKAGEIYRVGRGVYSKVSRPVAAP